METPAVGKELIHVHPSPSFITAQLKRGGLATCKSVTRSQDPPFLWKAVHARFYILSVRWILTRLFVYLKGMPRNVLGICTRTLGGCQWIEIGCTYIIRTRQERY